MTALTGTTYDIMPSPIGELLMTSDGDALTALYMQTSRWGRPAFTGMRRDGTAFSAVREQLDAYFAGDLTTFDLSLAPDGTEFQRTVWMALREIPYATTQSYGDIARRIDNPKGVRAVGLANGRNPISIIVPCHRVIGSDGSLTGYGGGLERKKWLLEHEARHAHKTSARQGMLAL